jgi:hypothetical protein
VNMLWGWQKSCMGHHNDELGNRGGNDVDGRMEVVDGGKRRQSCFGNIRVDEFLYIFYL